MTSLRIGELNRSRSHTDYIEKKNSLILPGPLFIKRAAVLPSDLVKILSREIGS